MKALATPTAPNSHPHVVATGGAVQTTAPGKVLVLGQGTSSFLAVIRSLGRQKIEVHVGWCPSDCPALKSRYVARYHAISPYSPNGDWEQKLIALMAREHFDLVLPTNEQSLRPLQQCRASLQEAGRIYVLDDHAFDVVFDKARSLSLAESLGLRVPRSQIVYEQSGCSALGKEFGWPVVLKPLSSYRPENLRQRRDVVKAYGPEELESESRRLLADGPVLAQECFVGVGVGVELLVQRGKILVAFQHERVHQPPRGGESSYRKSVALRDDLVQAASRLVAALSFTGVIMVEFLVDPRGDDWRFVEMNGRFWGSLPLAVAAGVDFPFHLYQLLVQGKESFPVRYREGLYCRNLIGDLAWAAGNLRADHSDPTLATVPWWRAIRELGRLLTMREKSDTFVADDLRPGFAELAFYARRFLNKLGRRLRAFVLPRAATRTDIEKNAMRPTVLFYHQVVRRPRPDHYFFRQSLTLDQFREAMEFVRRHYHPLSAERMWQLCQAGDRFPPRSVLITFDDGFRNNLLAAEILHELGMNALFFVLSDTIDTDFKPWYLRFAHIMSTRQKASCQAAWGEVSFDDALARRRWLAAAKEHLLATAAAERDRQLEQLAKKLECPPIDPADEDYDFLGTNDLRRMRELGMTIGGHSATHDNLSRCTNAELHREMVDSSERLAEASGGEIAYFSYPDGRYDERVLGIARRQFRMAFAASCDLPKNDLWRYPRRAADDCTAVSSVLSRWYPLRRRAAETAKRLLGESRPPKPK